MKGFSMIEVLIATFIATIVGGLLLSILVSNTGLFYQQSTRVNQGLGLNDAMLSIRSVIKEANSVSIGYPESSPNITTGESVLVLKLPVIDPNGQVISGGFDYGVFIVEDAKLKLKIYPSTSPPSSRKAQDQILASEVESIVFNFYDPSGNEVTPVSSVKVKTTLVLRQKAGAVYETNVATAEASLRND